MSIAVNTTGKRIFIPIILTGLVAGTLDAVAAIIWAHKLPPEVIFEYIASGVFGKAAFQGGTAMVVWGLTFHYIIAMGFTVAFYFIYARFYKIFQNKYIIACAYGILAWFIMNLVVVPLSQIGFTAFKHVSGVLIGMGILIICIGLPVSLVADRKRTR